MNPQERAYATKVVSLVRDMGRNLDIPAEEFQEILKISPTEYQDLLGLKRPVKLSEISNLARHFRFSLDRLDRDQIDLEAIRQRHRGNILYLPPRYTIGAFSRKVMIINVLNYVQSRYGDALRSDLMDYFHLTDAIFDDPNGWINYVFFEDAIQYLRSRGINDVDVHRIGVCTIDTNRDSWLAQAMSNHPNARAMYEYYLNYLLKFVEQNNSYRVARLSNTECVLESHEYEEVLDIFKVRHIGGKNRCQYRIGALSAATRYMGLPCADVKEIRCVHHGDPFCSFLINFEKANEFLTHSPKAAAR